MAPLLPENQANRVSGSNVQVGQFRLPKCPKSDYRTHTYFFTVNLLERRRDTLVRHVEALREAVRVTRRERPFHIDAWVVLPDHMHCVWTLPAGDDDFSNRWKAIKPCRYCYPCQAP